jgi:predicted secreted protein
MGAQKGKDLLLKVDFDDTATFATVAGMRTRRIAFNAEAVDITNADVPGAGASCWKARGFGVPGYRAQGYSRTRRRTRACARSSSTAASGTGR